MSKSSRHLLAVLFHQWLKLSPGLLVLIFSGALTRSHTLDTTTNGARRLANTPAANSSALQTLSPQTPVASEIAGGQTQSFIITLSKGQRLQATIAKADLDLQLTAFDPAGSRLREFLSRRYGRLTISFIATAIGPYRLDVRSLETEPQLKPYELRVADLKQATPQDWQNDQAVQLTAEAEILQAQWSESAIRGAIEKFTSAWSVWRRSAQRKEAAEALTSIGDCYFTLSEYRQALDYFRRAIAESRAAGDRQGERSAMNRAGRVFSYTGEDLQVLVNARQVLARLKGFTSQPSVEDRRAEAEALCHMGEAQYLIGKLREALDFFDRALAIWTELGDRRGQALARLNRGYALSESGALQQAAEQHQQARDLSREVGERRVEAMALTAIGGVHSFLSEHLQALDFHRKAQAIFKVIGDRQGEASALNGIARAYGELNELQAALDYYTSALRIYQVNGSRDSEAVALLYIGQVHRSMRETAQALNSFRRGLALSRKLQKQRVATYALLELATMDHSLGHNRQALSYYQQALRFYRKVGDRPGQAMTLNRIGDIYLTATKWRQALPYFQEALQLSQAVQDRSQEVETRYNLGRAARAGGQMDEALTHAEAAIQLIESLRMGVSGPAFRASYFASTRKHYELYIDLLMQKHKEHPNEGFAARALYASESARARVLLDLLAEMKAEIREGVEPALLKSERDLEQSLNAKGQYQIRLLNDKSGEKQSEEVAEEIRRLSSEYNRVQAQIRQQSPRYATLKHPQPLQLSEAQKELPDDGTLLLEYFLGSERSYLWAVTARTFAAYELPGRVQIEERAREVYRLLTARQPATGLTFEEHQARVAEADRQYADRAASLSELLLGPIVAQLAGNRLLVVADGALHYIPFEALPHPRVPKEKLPDSPDVGAGNFAPLVLQHEVISLPSASALASIRRATATSPHVSKGIFVLADPVFERDDPRVVADHTLANRTSEAGEEQRGLRDVLRSVTGSAEAHGLPRLQATLQEAEGIVALAPAGQRRMATGFDASRATAMNDDLRRYQIVHFATHALVNHEHPELSGIVLSLVDKQGNQENGFLQLHDIYNLRLSAELVTLSACSTGLGKEVSGEGLVGLTRGFMYAGAKGVLASLWKVDDRATAELMQRYYRELLVERKSPAGALRAAKVALWRQKRWQAPFYWASFVFQGDPAGVIILSSAPWYKRNGLPLIITLFLTLLIGIYAIRWMKKRGDRRRKGRIQLP